MNWDVIEAIELNRRSGEMRRDMKIVIDSVEVSESKIKIALSATDFAEVNRYEMSREISQSVYSGITKALVDEYLKQNMHKILSSIDQQQILNMITISAAKKITN